jgi:flagellar capping protein FliD
MMINPLGASGSVNYEAMAKGLADAERIPKVARIEGLQQDATLQLSAWSQYKSSVSKIADNVPTFTDDMTTEDKVSLVKKFAETYNSQSANIKKLTQFNPATNEAGALISERIVRQSSNEIRRIDMSNSGLSFSREGQLNIDENKLTSAIESGDFDSVLSKLDKAVSSVADNNSINTKMDSLNSRLSSLAEQKSDFNERMDDRESAYLKQFLALDNLMNSFSQTNLMLSQQFFNLSAS